MNTTNKKTGYTEEICNPWRMPEIKLCKTCKKSPTVYTIRDYLDDSRIHLLGIKIHCEYCKNGLKGAHKKFLMYDPEMETLDEIAKQWNLLNE